MGKGGSGSTEIKETVHERAAAEIAQKQWALYLDELKPMEDLFISQVDNLNHHDQYSARAGTVNLGYQQAFGAGRQQTATALAAGGVDPSSGRFQGALRDVQRDQIAGQMDTTNRAQVAQQDKYTAGLQDVMAMGAGQQADALSGYRNIASHSLSKATEDAQQALSDRQAVGQLVGTVGGLAARTYGLKETNPRGR
ncbi:hypothetical protein [Yersinia mollaretii]|uniref:hypothetical protein n=1 Tax=Yersinia mollaretii TaxID=33060 RepID=UPI00119CB55A|nr:hypothetical protein [Yersinia mollaretii]